MKNTNKASFSATALSEQADFPKGEAFSLVELMLSLIIISLIAAAFTPIITKKLKTSSIYAGGGAQQITNKCDDFGDNCELCTKQYCISCNLECSTGQFVDTKICNTCENCPDNCEECESATKCTKCKSGNNGYAPVNGFCTKCEGSTPYSTGTECTTGCVASDGSYCDSSGNIKSCASKFSNCATCDNNKCKSCIAYHSFINGVCTDCGVSGCIFCTKVGVCETCQGDRIKTSEGLCPYVVGSGINGDLPGCSSFWGTTDNHGCNGCLGDYFYNTSKTCTKCTLDGCQKCKDGQSADNPECSSCKSGYYIDSSGKCQKCNSTSKFGENCATCTQTNCLSCNSGYSLADDTTGVSSCKKADDNTFSCSDSNFMKIGNLCITRRNMGDADTVYLKVPYSANVITVDVGQKCYAYSDKCCWKGDVKNTAGSCNDDNGGYSGCHRTVCNFEAANAICANFNYAGKKWRLPTSSEIASWGISSPGLGINGLQLCDSRGGYNSAQCDSNYDDCLGSSLNFCRPSIVCALSSGKIYNLSLYSGIGSVSSGSSVDSSAKTGAYSVRCVTEMND